MILPPAFFQNRGQSGRAPSLFYPELCPCSQCLRVGAEGEVCLLQKPAPRAEGAGRERRYVGVGMFTGCLPQPASSLLALILTSFGEPTWSQRLEGREAQSCPAPRWGWGMQATPPTPHAQSLLTRTPPTPRPSNPSPGSLWVPWSAPRSASLKVDTAAFRF